MGQITSIPANCVAVTPGVVRKVLLIPCDEILREPLTNFESSNGTLSTAEDKKTIHEVYEYKDNDSFFHEVDAAINTVMGKADSVGDGGAAGFENSFEFTIQNDTAATRNLADELTRVKACGCGVIALLQNPDTLNYDIFGTFYRPCQVTAINGSTGDKPGGTAREYKFSLSGLNGVTPKIYPSTLAVRTARIS